MVSRRQGTITVVELAGLLGVQLFAAWVLFFYLPATVSWYMDHGQDTPVPAILHHFWNLPNLFHNTPWLWFPLWVLATVGLGLWAWRRRERVLPRLLVIVLTLGQLVYLAAMVFLSSRHLASVGG